MKITFITCIACLIFNITSKAQTWKVFSPDSSIQINIVQKTVNTKLQTFYTVYLNTQLIIDESKIGIVSNGQDLTEGSTISIASQNVIDENYSMIVGKKSLIRNNANELILKFHNTSKNGVNVAFRAYNDGIAYRYLFDGTGQINISNENSYFTIKDNVKGWLQDWTQGWSYEKIYNATTSLNIGTNLIAFPALLKVNNNKFVLISESNISGNYIGSHLKQDTITRNIFQIDFETSVTATLPLKTPWRTAIIGDLKTIFESTMITNLAEPCQISDLSWITPGAVTFPWLSDHNVNGNQTRLKQFIDLAAEMGWKWIEFDQALVYGDNGASTSCTQWKNATWIPSIVQYAKSKGIKVFGWHRWDCTNTQAEADDLLGYFVTNGFSGIKVDFLDSDSPDRFKYRDFITQQCANKKLMISFHGETVPRGQQRTWPNIMTHEAVLGEERYTFGLNLPNPSHNVFLCFTRNVLGSMDYTPTTFAALSGSAYQRITTNAHEMALAVVFESGWQCIGAPPEDLTNANLAKDFLKNLPTVWDDTKFIAGDPDGFIVLARKTGQKWYVAGINTATQRTVNMNLDFIKSGIYSTTIFKDNTALTDVATQTIQVNTANPYSITLPANGGFGFIIDESVNCTPQTITFDSIPNKRITDPDFTVQASTSSGLPVTYSIITGPATVTGNTIHLTGLGGKVMVSAYQNGDTSHCSVSTINYFNVIDPNAGDGVNVSYWTAKGVANQWPQVVPPTWFIDSICGEIVPNINQGWPDDSILGKPSCLPNQDFWNARYIGYIKPLYTEIYTFCTTEDDGAKLWINGQVLVNDWPGGHLPEENCGTIALKAGVLYPLRLDFAEYWAAASIKFEWYSTHQAREVVPQSQLFTSNVINSINSNFSYENAINIYPNPMSDQLFIKNKNLKIEKITLTDLAGRTVYQINTAFTGDKIIQLNSFTKGMYFITINGDNFNITKKIIIQQ